MNLEDYHGTLPFSYSGKNIVYKSHPNIPRKQIDEELYKSEIYSKFKPFRKIDTSPVFVHKKRDTFQTDLAFFTTPQFVEATNGYQYLLLVIDCFTKKLWLVPLKDKKCKTVYREFENLFQNIDILPKKIQSDRGTEFLCPEIQKLFKRKNIIHYITHSDRKASIAERAIRTIKGILYKMMDYKNTYNWVNLLPEVTKKYLSTYHRTIKMSPNEAELEKNQFLLRQTYHKNWNKYKYEKKAKFKVGDKVRLYGYRSKFTRSFWQSYTDEYFIIYKIIPTIPLRRSRYYLKDLNGNKLARDPSFWSNELSLYKPDDNTYDKIEKIIGRRKKNNKTQYLVKWLGWGEEFNEWIDENQMKNV